jgi:hypothetical protein
MNEEEIPFPKRMERFGKKALPFQKKSNRLQRRKDERWELKGDGDDGGE